MFRSLWELIIAREQRIPLTALAFLLPALLILSLKALYMASVNVSQGERHAGLPACHRGLRVKHLKLNRSLCHLRPPRSLRKSGPEFFHWSVGIGPVQFLPCSLAVPQFWSRMEFKFLLLNRTGKDGKGNPVFTGEVDCTYFFTWDTKYACVKEKEDLLCGAVDGKKRYDLSALVRHAGTALLAVWVSVHVFVEQFP